nr:FAD-binding oxidoreductase [Thalassococcus arenae]
MLFSNDERGEYPDSWYAATTDFLPVFAPLQGETRADVCVIGGGYTGLSAALHLAEAGADVVLVEAHRVGFGASGRNGGQLGSGQRQDQLWLEKTLGTDTARLLWQLGEDAKALVRDLVRRHGIDCALRDGIAWAARSPGSQQDMADYAEHVLDAYDHEMQVLDAEAFHALCPSPDYCGGVLDMSAAHLHPLRLALGLARAADKAGARIHEHTWVHDIKTGPKPVVRTEGGLIRADAVILATNGYVGGLHRRVASRVMPINNFVTVTEPLGALADTVLTRDVAVADDRFVVNYFRLTEDRRLLFGGGESYGYRFPADIRAKVRKPMLKVFPHLADVPLDYAWGGTLGITLSRLPHFERIGETVLSAAGYSGHGIGNAVQAGKLMADALRGRAEGFDTFADLPTPPFPGGGALRHPILALAMSWYAMRDRLGF